jgi:HD-GYP domain-containing protein (c-di-GMP phosphodiesterase class II)
MFAKDETRPTGHHRHPMAIAAALGAAVLAFTGALVLPARLVSPSAASPRLASGWERGLTLTDWTSDGLDSAGGALDGAMSVGADRVVLTPTLYVPDTSSAAIAPDPERTVTTAALTAGIREARGRGLAVTLKPHIDVADGTPRTDIAPADPAAWLAAYSVRLLGYARLAQRTGVDTFVVGDELSGLDGDSDAWRAIVAAVRAVFPGHVTYAANWDRAAAVDWWDAVDAIGVDAYMPLTDADHPGAAQLDAGWVAARAQLAALHAQWNRPVLLTEIGYPDRVGAARAPWDPATAAAPDPAQQAAAVDAAFRALGREPWIAGAYWWDWPVDADAVSSYALRGRAAASVLAAWQAAGGPPRAAGIVPDAPPLLALGLAGALVALTAFWFGTARNRTLTWSAEDAARVLLAALRVHDPDAATHSLRVGQLAGATARRLGLPGSEVQELRCLGELHDVGKLRVPAAILLKPGRLTPPEREVARRWGAWSAELVGQLPELAGSAVVLELACQMDGETPLAAQIIAACDAFDAMTHRRPYRPAVPARVVLAALKADTRFDPRLIAALSAVAATIPVEPSPAPSVPLSRAAAAMAAAARA